MTLTIALQTAVSGLNAAQTNLRAVSDNISNVNTPGFVRKTVDQRELVVAGRGAGVEIVDIRRVTDQFLQLASLTASAESSRFGVLSQFLDNAQSLFGDPSSDTFFFNRLNTTFAAFGALANDPSNTLLRAQALSTTEDFINDSTRINDQIAELRTSVNTGLAADVSRANDLLQQISQLNADISRAKVAQGDATGSENGQSQLLDELSSLLNVQINLRAGGGVEVRSSEGVLLAGDKAATLTYNSTDSTPGFITATDPDGAAPPKPILIESGEIRGLLDLRDDKLPALSDELGEFVTRAVEQLNIAHNASSAIPAPATLTGRDTGLDLPTAISGFTGQSTIAIVDASGVLQHRVDIDFSAVPPTFSVNLGPPTPTSPATFLADLNTALGASGSATYVNNKLSISATGANGVAIQEGTSQKAGRGFSAFFGLNDLVQANGFNIYETGLKPTDNHGFTGAITFRLTSQDGRPLRDITIPAPGAPLVSDLLNALNSTTTGVGLFGTFSLDADGQLTFAGAPPASPSLSVVNDTTQRGAGGPSISQLFGIGVVERDARASTFFVNPALKADPTKLALAQLDLTVPLTEPTLRPGDGRGAVALAGSGEVTRLFQAAGDLGRINTTVQQYAAQLAGAVGREAAAADTRRQGAEAVQTEADARRQSIESVNIDEELVRLQTFQQAYNAAARVIQATNDLFDALLRVI